VFMICWNYVSPAFWKGAPELSFWQSLAVVLLARIAIKPSVTVNKKNE
jgi:hypothetical protein